MPRVLLTNSKKVRYLRATIKDAKYFKPLRCHGFGNWVARESLRRGLPKGSLTFGSELTLPTGSQKTPSARVPGVFSCASPNSPDVKRFAAIRAHHDVPPLSSLVRDETRGPLSKCHVSPRHPVPNAPKLSDSLVHTPLQVNGTFRYGGRSGQLSNWQSHLPPP